MPKKRKNKNKTKKKLRNRPTNSEQKEKLSNASYIIEDNVKDTNQKNKKIKNAFIFGSLGILVLSSTSFICLSTSKMQDISYNGVYIDSEHVGKLNKEQLTEKLTSLLSDKVKNTVITIEGKSENITTTPLDLNITYKIDEIVNNILSYNKKGNSLTDTISRLSLHLSNKSVDYSPTIDNEKLDNFINKIVDNFEVEPTNASITFKGNTISATEEKEGYIVDESRLKKDLIEYINSNFNGINTIQLSYVEKKAPLTKDIAEKMQILGTFKTKLPSKTGDRTNNIKIYTSKLNKSILEPGEELSCDTKGGSRTWADGYRYAPGYVNGEVVPILAGGICQATSTIYNAVLYADLEITERHPHSMPVRYAELGLDAAIANGVKDLKFKNNTDSPIILQTYVDDDGYVVASIWGIPTVANKKIELVTKKYNSKAADAYKKTYIDGKLVKTELLSKNRYK